MVPVQDIKPFDGKHDDVEEWLEMYEDFAILNDWDDDIKSQKLIHFLTEDAAKWFREHRLAIEPDLSDWSEIKSGLLQFFALSKDRQVQLALIRHRKWEEQEPIQSYWLAKQQLIRRSKLPLTVDEQVTHYLQGLPQSIQNILPKRFYSVENAFNAIRRQIDNQRINGFSWEKNNCDGREGRSPPLDDDKLIEELDQAKKRIENLEETAEKKEIQTKQLENQVENLKSDVLKCKESTQKQFSDFRDAIEKLTKELNDLNNNNQKTSQDNSESSEKPFSKESAEILKLIQDLDLNIKNSEIIFRKAFQKLEIVDDYLLKKLDITKNLSENDQIEILTLISNARNQSSFDIVIFVRQTEAILNKLSRETN